MKPLEGTLVLELGQVIAAPYASLLLADLGAEVVKVERPGVGDSSRDPAVTEMLGLSATFVTFNRNKRSVELDLKDPQGYEDFLALVRRADVVVNNFVPSVAKRLGVDHKRLAAANPRIVTCAITGFGDGSPHGDQPSYDLIHQALSGYMMLTGVDSDPPTRVGVPLADLAAGLFGAYGVLAALQARERTGHGDAVDVSMYDCLISLLTYQATVFFATGEEPERMGSAHEFVIPWQAFEASDGFFVVAARTGHFWDRFCRAIEVDGLVDDPRFADNQSRLHHRAELDAILDPHFRGRAVADWLERLRGNDVPCAPVRRLSDALTDSHLDRRKLVGSFTYDGVDQVRTVGNPVRFTTAETAAFAPPPLLGADQLLIERVGGHPEEGWA